MTVVRVSSMGPLLDEEQRAQLGERLTRAVLEVEVGADRPEVRPGVMVLFESLPTGHWFHMGRPVEDLYDGERAFSITATVMDGPWTDARKAELVSRLAEELRAVVPGAKRECIWTTLHIVSDGAWSVNGGVVRIRDFYPLFEPEAQQDIRANLGDDAVPG